MLSGMADGVWPFGAALRTHREDAGLSARRAAKLAGISEGRWRQLESGVQKIRGGIEVPIGTTAGTVMAAAKAVGWPAGEALSVAGFDPVAELRVAGRPPVAAGPVGWAELDARQRDAVQRLVSVMLDPAASVD